MKKKKTISVCCVVQMRILSIRKILSFLKKKIFYRHIEKFFLTVIEFYRFLFRQSHPKNRYNHRGKVVVVSMAICLVLVIFFALSFPKPSFFIGTKYKKTKKKTFYKSFKK